MNLHLFVLQGISNTILLRNGRYFMPTGSVHKILLKNTHSHCYMQKERETRRLTSGLLLLF